MFLKGVQPSRNKWMSISNSADGPEGFQETSESAHSLGRDDVLPLLAVKLGNTLDGHVVALGRARRKNDVFRVGPDQVGDVLDT